MKNFVIAILFLLLIVPISYPNNNCPRRVEIMAIGKVDVGEDYTNFIDDSTFNVASFLKNFGNFFPKSKLKLNESNIPEYSITATFIKKKGRFGYPNISILAIVFSFNAGENCSEPNITSSPASKGESYYYCQNPLFTWISSKNSHKLRDHITSISSQIEASNLEEFLDGFERIPIKAEITEKSPGDWCEFDAENPLLIFFSNFETSSPPKGPSLSRTVRFFVKAERGTIENGNFSSVDHLAKIFSISVTGFDGRIEIHYRPPEEADKSDKITIYNSCEICDESIVPLSATEKKEKLIELEISCAKGSIEYNHKIDFNYGTFSQTVTITGSVPFKLEELPGGRLPKGSTDNPKVKGKGTVNLSLIWTAEDCVGRSDSPGEIEFEGEIINENEEKFIDIKFDEKWYQNSVLTVTCPEVTKSVPMTIPPPVKYENMKFKFKDGEKITRPFAGMGGNGIYSWTIRLPDSAQ